MVVDHEPFSVNTDFSLAPVQKHCLIQTQRKVKYNPGFLVVTKTSLSFSGFVLS